MSLLDSEHTVQAATSTAEAVASLRAWVAAPSGACLVVGPSGSGKSHLLNGAAGSGVAPVVMPPPDGSDCSEFVGELRSRANRLVVADDLDQFPKGLREEVIGLVAESGHVLLASMTELSSRTRRLLFARCGTAVIVTLEDAAARAEDVEAFIAHWISLSDLAPEGQAVGDCTAFCCASGLPRGFRTVENFLLALAGSGWTFSGPLPAAYAATAYRQAIAPPATRPTILVEGYTDRVYLEWLLQDSPAVPAVEVRDCGGASRVAEQLISLRNQGRRCVGVLDSDEVGKRLRKQLVGFGHPVVVVPVDAVNLPESAYDHVQRVAEIEDLLPVSVLEEFIRGGRAAELEVRAPTGVRYVVGESDKRDLAHWVVEEVERQAVPKLARLLKDALALLGVAP